MKKLNQKGSTLIAVVTVIMLIFVVLGIALGIATSYQQRSIDEHARKQAYLNGVSFAEVVASQMASESTRIHFIPVDSSQTIHVGNNGLPANAGGRVSANIRLDENNENLIYIQVTSIYNEKTEEVQLTMEKYKNTWYKKVFSKIGDEFNDQEQ